MQTFYSKTTGGFYPENMRDVYEAAGTWPTDATPVSADEEAVLRTPPEPTYDALSAAFLATVRNTREEILNRLAGIGFAALADSDNDAVAVIKQARLDLLDITSAPAVVAAINIEALKTAVLNRYREIVAAVPTDIKSAFDKVAL